jgi:hypothetical protein
MATKNKTEIVEMENDRNFKNTKHIIGIIPIKITEEACRMLTNNRTLYTRVRDLFISIISSSKFYAIHNFTYYFLKIFYYQKWHVSNE